MKERGMGAKTGPSEQRAQKKRRRGAIAQGHNELEPTEADEQEQEAVEAQEPGPDRSSVEEAEDSEATGADDQSADPTASDLATAAQQLSRLTGINVEAATSALRETQEKVFSDNAADSNTLQIWLEEAQIWLACGMEVQDEIDEVRTAMHESLQEYEAAKAADDMPLAQRPPDYLRNRFLGAVDSATAACVPRSEVFARLSTFACHRVLFADGDHKAPLVKLAELESKCRRWYPNSGTSRYWEQLAAACASEAAAAAPPDLQLRQEGWVGCAQGADYCTNCAAALGWGDGSGAGPSKSHPVPAGKLSSAAVPRRALPAAAAPAVMAALGSFAARKVEMVQQEVCRMPTISGQVPDLFTSLDDQQGEGGHSDTDDIVVLDAIKGGAGKQGAQVVEL